MQGKKNQEGEWRAEVGMQPGQRGGHSGESVRGREVGKAYFMPRTACLKYLCFAFQIQFINMAYKELKTTTKTIETCHQILSGYS